MKQVPDMISSKDLDYISDMFNWNFNASKVAHHFSEESTDEDVKQILHEGALMHSQICHKLINMLGGHNE